ncbi:hypothetical protein N2W54_004728 [Lotmaria passim]
MDGELCAVWREQALLLLSILQRFPFADATLPRRLGFRGCTLLRLLLLARGRLRPPFHAAGDDRLVEVRDILSDQLQKAGLRLLRQPRLGKGRSVAQAVLCEEQRRLQATQSIGAARGAIDPCCTAATAGGATPVTPDGRRGGGRGRPRCVAVPPLKRLGQPRVRQRRRGGRRLRVRARRACVSMLSCCHCRRVRRTRRCCCCYC